VDTIPPKTRIDPPKTRAPRAEVRVFFLIDSQVTQTGWIRCDFWYVHGLRRANVAVAFKFWHLARVESRPFWKHGWQARLALVVA